jgi:urease accessory protein
MNTSTRTSAEPAAAGRALAIALQSPSTGSSWRTLRPRLTCAALAWVPLAAEAQTPDAPYGAWLSGPLHPFSGLDQLLVALGVGMWSAQQRGRLRWLLPLSFVAVMVASAVLGFGSPARGSLEQALAATVLLSGLFVASRLQTRLMPAMLAAGLFALLQGVAHGTSGNGDSAQVLGFTVATLLIGAAGYGLAHLAQRLQAEAALQLTGGAVAVAGLAMSIV